MHRYVLDTSALLAVAFGENGASYVEPYLLTSVISAVNAQEAMQKIAERNTPLDEIQKEFELLGVITIPYDYEQAVIAAKWQPILYRKNISLGDRCCLALAKAKNYSVLTADQAWLNLGLDIKIEIIR